MSNSWRTSQKHHALATPTPSLAKGEKSWCVSCDNNMTAWVWHPWSRRTINTYSRRSYNVKIDFVGVSCIDQNYSEQWFWSYLVLDSSNYYNQIAPTMQPPKWSKTSQRIPAARWSNQLIVPCQSWLAFCSLIFCLSSLHPGNSYVLHMSLVSLRNTTISPLD